MCPIVGIISSWSDMTNSLSGMPCLSDSWLRRCNASVRDKGHMSVDVVTNPDDWVDRHGGNLHRYALLRLRSPDLAADVIQETFLEAVRARNHFSRRSSKCTGLVRPA